MNHPPPRWQFHSVLVADLDPLTLVLLIVALGSLAVTVWLLASICGPRRAARPSTPEAGRRST